jgi:hypothetical protein
VIDATISSPSSLQLAPVAVTRVPMSLGRTAGSCLHAEIATTLAAVDILAADWMALEQQSNGRAPSPSFTDCRLLIKSQLAAGLAPQIITIWSGSCLQAVWLLQLQPSRGSQLLVEFGIDGAMITPVFKADADHAELARHLIAVARTIGADGLLLRRVLAVSALAAALPPVGPKQHAVAARDHAIPFTWRGRLVLAAWC